MNTTPQVANTESCENCGCPKAIDGYRFCYACSNLGRCAKHDSTAVHADYPHEPGRLPGCAACENGPCQCNPETDAPCVSDHCVQGDKR